MAGQMGAEHYGAEWMEMAPEKAEGIIREELGKRAKGDGGEGETGGAVAGLCSEGVLCHFPALAPRGVVMDILEP